MYVSPRRATRRGQPAQDWSSARAAHHCLEAACACVPSTIDSHPRRSRRDWNPRRRKLNHARRRSPTRAGQSLESGYGPEPGPWTRESQVKPAMFAVVEVPSERVTPRPGACEPDVVAIPRLFVEETLRTAPAGSRGDHPFGDIGLMPSRNRSQSPGSDAALSRCRGQSGWVCRSKWRPLTPSVDLLGHPADVTADDRATEMERLLDHERGVLPPDRRDDDPIDVRHEAASSA